MQAIEHFAAEAERFRDWALTGRSSGHAAGREAVERVTRLYLAGLALPPPRVDETGDEAEDVDVDDAEVQAVMRSCNRFPLDYYGEILDPLTVPPEEPGLGSLSDDISDIYRDVVRGLLYFRAGQLDQALWQWSFHFEFHWGAHATGAIRALHSWLSANGFHELKQPGHHQGLAEHDDEARGGGEAG